jgi:amphi-Trp domain-containing protein
VTPVCVSRSCRHSPRVVLFTPIIAKSGSAVLRYGITKTSHTDSATRGAVADRLETLAKQLRSDEAEIQVGNKTVRLSPAEEINYEIDVREGSSFLRGRRESIELELGWKPEK